MYETDVYSIKIIEGEKTMYFVQFQLNNSKSGNSDCFGLALSYSF